MVPVTWAETNNQILNRRIHKNWKIWRKISTFQKNHLNLTEKRCDSHSKYWENKQMIQVNKGILEIFRCKKKLGFYNFVIGWKNCHPFQLEESLRFTGYVFPSMIHGFATPRIIPWSVEGMHVSWMIMDKPWMTMSVKPWFIEWSWI